MKKRISIFVALVLCFAQLVGCGGTKGSVELSKNQLNLALFAEAEITATCKDLEGDLVWENSNPDIVVMTKSSTDKVKVLGIASGASVITAKCGDISKECNVVVEQTTEKLVLSTTSAETVELIIGSTLPLNTSVKFKGELFDKATVSYTSSDTTIVTVNESGVLSAVSAGEAVIKARAKYYENLSNELNINVKVKNDVVLKVEKEEIDIYEPVADSPFPSSCVTGVTLLEAGNVVDGITYEYTIEDESVVKVENNNFVGLKAGKSQVDISCTYENENYTVSVMVNVLLIPDIKMTLNSEKVTLYSVAPVESYKTTKKLNASVAIDDIADENAVFAWKVTEGENVVSVDETGLVKAKGVGTAKVEATYNYNGVLNKKTAEINVISPVSYGEHEFYAREGVLATIKEGTELKYDNLTLADGKDNVFLQIQKIPRKMISDKSKYPLFGGQTPEPIAPDSRSLRDLRLIYITLTDAENADNSITIGLRVYLQGDGFDAEIALGAIGVRTNKFPAMDTYNDFLGAWNGNVTSALTPFGLNGGYGYNPYFSFYGIYLDDITDKNTLGFALEGTALYIHSDNKVTKIWDLNADTIAFAGAFPDNSIKAEHAWTGFSSDKVNISISGDYYDSDISELNLSILNIGGHATTAEDVAGFELVAK